MKAYYQLAKPGIIYGNVFTTLAAFLYTSHWRTPLSLLAATIVGMALVIGSACVFNNYLDRDIDRRMDRTNERPFVTGAISPTGGLTYGAVLGILGVALLFVYVNALTAYLAIAGFILYVVAYGAGKRASSWGAVIGSVPGAIPIIAGYTAVIGRLDPVAWILFLILVLWQMPHFYAIATYRIDEYRQAGIPTLPIVKGARRTKVSIMLYIAAFTIAASLLWFLKAAGLLYLIGMLVLGFVWFVYSIRGFRATDDKRWARSVFFCSLIVLVSFSVLLSIAWLRP